MPSTVRILVLAAALSVVVACAPADDGAASGSPGRESASAQASDTSTWTSDSAEIRAATEASAAAWNRGSLKEHLALYVDTVTFMTENGPRPGVDAVEKAFSEKYFSDGRPKQTLGFSQLTVRPLGRDAALETGRFQLTGGGEPEQSGWFTLVWVRTPDGWRAVHDHSS